MYNHIKHEYVVKYVYGTTSTFHTKSLGITHGLYFSSVVFLGLNLLCYLIIFTCYVEIVRAVFKSSKRTNLSKEVRDEVRMTAKVAAIVATDFCCWFPIILMGILVQGWSCNITYICVCLVSDICVTH